MSPVTRTKSPRRRGEPRGRCVEPNALAQVRALITGMLKRRDLLIEYLHRIQDACGHLSAAHLVALAHELKLAPTEIYEVATFYHHFDVVKQGDPPPPLTIRVCDSLSCEIFGANALLESLTQTVGDRVRVQRVPCVGRCDAAPVAVVGTNPIGAATTADVLEAIATGNTRPKTPVYTGYSQYRDEGGYRTLSECVAGHVDPDAIMTALEDSNLRGLGGAGFPVGRKWRIVKSQPAPRVLAVNVDEGEPGTFKDGYYIERDPHRFIEGMLIAATVVGIDQIYIYLRDEYAACRSLLEKELDALQSEPPCDFPSIHLRRGAGAYICGEESAMVESIEGKRGMPRLRPPYVAEVGVFGHPTLAQNMESLYWVRDILEKGADWFIAQGRRGRQGLRSFSVSGRVRRPGVHLAPAGITARELIDEYCDGMLTGHEFYGYFPGGASGGILPASLGDLPLDFDTLTDYGCFIGSAAVIVLSRQDSARDAALNAMRFFAHESCGKCTPCRVGTSKAVKLMEKPVWDKELMHELAQTMTDASICGLGQSAPNPMLCVLRYFDQELSDGR